MTKTPLQGYTCPHCGYSKTTMEHQHYEGFIFKQYCGGLILIDNDTGVLECSNCHTEWTRLPPITCFKCKQRIR